jgi:hypothetical protein
MSGREVPFANSSVSWGCALQVGACQEIFSLILVSNDVYDASNCGRFQDRILVKGIRNTLESARLICRKIKSRA